MFVIYSCLNDCCQKSVPCQISLHISFGEENLLKIFYCRLFLFSCGHRPQQIMYSLWLQDLAVPKCQLYIIIADLKGQQNV